MEQQQSTESLFSLEFDHQAASYISETAKWSRFLSIVSFIFCGIIILVAVFAGSMIASVGGAVTPGFSATGLGGFVTVIYLIFAAIWLVPNVFRYQFATRALQAIRNNDQAMLTESFGKLKTYNKYWGILTIIIISFYVLMFLIGLLI